MNDRIDNDLCLRRWAFLLTQMGDQMDRTADWETRPPTVDFTLLCRWKEDLEQILSEVNDIAETLS